MFGLAAGADAGYLEPCIVLQAHQRCLGIPGDVAGDDARIDAAERMDCRHWFVFEDIKRCAGEPVGRQCVGQRVCIDDPASGSVDQICRVLHHREPLGVDEVAGIGVERQVNTDDVGLAEDVLPARLGSMVLPKNICSDVGIVGQDAHVEGLHPLVDFASDIAEAEQSDGFVGQAHDGVKEVIVPDPTVDRRNGLWDFAHYAQQHGQGMVGDFLDAVVGHVDHHDTVVSCCRHIDTVVADAVADDHLEFGECGKDLAGEGCVLIE